MVSLLWNFYREVVVYHAMDAVKKTEKPAKEATQPPEPYKPIWDKKIVSKNLFSKLRGYTPPPPPPTEFAEPELPPIPLVPPELNLSGIILDQYGEYIAFIQKDGGSPKRVRKGDTFDGILVVDISVREVKLLWNDEELNLSMKKIKTVPKTKTKPRR
jgi:hypothetical protein